MQALRARATRSSLRVGGALAAIVAVVALGCALDVGPWDHEGTATISWTLRGRSDATRCADVGARHVEVRTIDAWGDEQAYAFPRCTAMRTDVTIERGWYHAELTLVDVDGRAISSTRRTDEFYVAQHRVIAVDAVDFPAYVGDGELTSRMSAF